MFFQLNPLEKDFEVRIVVNVSRGNRLSITKITMHLDEWFPCSESMAFARFLGTMRSCAVSSMKYHPSSPKMYCVQNIQSSYNVKYQGLESIQLFYRVF
jgi:hypothetical protein